MGTPTTCSSGPPSRTPSTSTMVSSTPATPPCRSASTVLPTTDTSPSPSTTRSAPLSPSSTKSTPKISPTSSARTTRTTSVKSVAPSPWPTPSSPPSSTPTSSAVTNAVTPSTWMASRNPAKPVTPIATTIGPGLASRTTSKSPSTARRSAKKAFYGKAFTPFQPIVDMFGQGLRKYGQKGEHTVVWNVADKFGNNAATVTKKIQITDTIPPTLYITKKDARATKNLQGDDCHRTPSAKWSAGNKGDYTNAECEFEHDDKHETFTHKSPMTDKNSHVVGESVHRDDPMATEMVIQHSAGYAEDYKFVEELMQEGTGYSCMDECSKTTTTVAWKKSCSSDGAGSEFNMLKPGTYFLKYTCTDGQHQTTACRTFINVDKTRPVITCLECSNHNDGNISQDVEVSGDVVNMAAVGTYKINYNCEDSA